MAELNGQTDFFGTTIAILKEGDIIYMTMHAESLVAITLADDTSTTLTLLKLGEAYTAIQEE